MNQQASRSKEQAYEAGPTYTLTRTDAPIDDLDWLRFGDLARRLTREGEIPPNLLRFDETYVGEREMDFGSSPVPFISDLVFRRSDAPGTVRTISVKGGVDSNHHYLIGLFTIAAARYLGEAGPCYTLHTTDLHATSKMLSLVLKLYLKLYPDDVQRVKPAVRCTSDSDDNPRDLHGTVEILFGDAAAELREKLRGDTVYDTGDFKAVVRGKNGERADDNVTLDAALAALDQLNAGVSWDEPGVNPIDEARRAGQLRACMRKLLFTGLDFLETERDLVVLSCAEGYEDVIATVPQLKRGPVTISMLDRLPVEHHPEFINAFARSLFDVGAKYLCFIAAGESQRESDGARTLGVNATLYELGVGVVNTLFIPAKENGEPRGNLNTLNPFGLSPESYAKAGQA